MQKPHRGQTRPDGAVFWNHTTTGREYWLGNRQIFLTAYFKYNCSVIKSRCLQRDIQFDLTPEYMASIYPDDGRCPVFGDAMELFDRPRSAPDRPSLDRVDPLQGYVPGNVQWIGFRANQLKNNATVPQLEAIITYMKAHQHAN